MIDVFGNAKLMQGLYQLQSKDSLYSRSKTFAGTVLKIKEL